MARDHFPTDMSLWFGPNRSNPVADAFRQPPNPRDISRKVQEYLNQQRQPKTALDIARGIGGKPKKEVNKVLYKLQKDGVVQTGESSHGKKPLWSLSREAMASNMFRNSQADTSAPGAYNPSSMGQHDSRGSGQLDERQHHRHVGRNFKAPYPLHHAKPNKNIALGSIMSGSQKPVVPSDSGIVSDSDEANTSGSRQQHSGNETNAFHQVQGQTAAAARDRDDIGDDGDSADEDYDYFEEGGDDVDPNMARYQDMMGDLMFTDMPCQYDEEMDEAERGIPAEEEVIFRISTEPGQSMSVSKLAEVLEMTEEEIRHLLQACAQHVQVSGHLCSLTDSGKVLAQERFESDPCYEQERPSYEQSGDTSHLGKRSPGARAALPPSLPKQGKPPTPQELLASYPDFGPSDGGALNSSTHAQKSSTGKGWGRGSGRGLLALTDAETFLAVRRERAHTVFGTHDVRDIEARSMQPPPPPSSFSPSSHQSLRVTTSVADQDGKGETTGGLRTVEVGELDWKPLSAVSPKAEPASDAGPTFQPPSYHQVLPSAQTRPPTGAGGLMSLQGLPRAPFSQMPSPSQGLMSSQSQPIQFVSMPTSLQRFTGEGLTLVFRPHAPVDVIEQQMSKTGLSAHSFGGIGPTESSSLHYSGPVSMETGIPRSHSLPLLNAAGASSMSAGDNSTLKITSESFAALNKNPISALMEYAQSRRMQAIIEVVHQRGPSHRPVFVMAAKVGSRQFPGVTCHNKKDGRKEAADVALRTLIAEGQYSAATPTSSVDIAPENMTHFDKVAALTHQTFNSLIASIPENLAGRKVIAGLVMQRGVDDVGVVISIGTGNRCITGDKLSLEGNTVNDSHAEIITRRGFMRFLYQQLLTYDPNTPHDLFEKGNSGKLRVKAGITFHLYISTAPCGDGALFSPRDAASNSGVLAGVENREHSPTFTSNVQGLLRTKMEGGEGTIPVDTKEVTMQTWDGVVRGERLRTMSCTDKICRWNVLGLQGALLSHFVEPVYLDSLTLGFLYDHGHLSRAVCCRLARDPPPLETVLPSGFHLNHPWLGRVTACQPLRETQKTKAFSINWTLGDPKPEVLDGTLGHCHTVVEKQLFSRLAKRSLYDNFKQVAQHFGRPDLLHARTYHQNKMAVADFQAAKIAMIKKFQQLGCGWVKKPVEEEMFS
ncbi:double-stranded RNA-specific adenosine deaminase-like [Littorina saxatilis]|uniref:double-stranded RNA-specific adenosine deaminase-like n=1 Tax=Littorina saxatilis TaxID=31220 RepID=UPI0038B63A1A